MPENDNNIQFGEEFDKSDFSLIDSGTYEVAIEKIEPRVSAKSGKRYLNFTFKIRGDVDQKFQNRKLFWSVFQKDNDSCYDFARINKLILTQKDTSGYKTRFIDFDEVLLYLNGIHLVLEVETNFDDYYNEDRNNVKEWSFAPSAWDKADHSGKDFNSTLKTVSEHAAGDAKPASGPVEVADDDLPF